MNRHTFSMMLVLSVFSLIASYTPFAASDWLREELPGSQAFSLEMNPVGAMPGLATLASEAGGTRVRYFEYQVSAGWVENLSYLTSGPDQVTYNVSLAFTAAGEPAIAYIVHTLPTTGCTATSELYFLARIRGTWQSPEAVATASYPVRDNVTLAIGEGFQLVSLAFDRANDPVIAYSTHVIYPGYPPCTYYSPLDDNAATVNVVRRNTDGSWPTSDEISDNQVFSDEWTIEKLSLRMDPLRLTTTEQPVIVFSYTDCYNGDYTSHIVLGVSNSEGLFSCEEILFGTMPSLEFNPVTKVPTLTYADEGELYYAVRPSTSWEESRIGTVENVSDSDLAFTSLGELKIVCFRSYSGGPNLTDAWALDSATWHQMPLVTMTAVSWGPIHPEIVLDPTTGMPYVAGITGSVGVFQPPRITVRIKDRSLDNVYIPPSSAVALCARSNETPYTRYYAVRRFDETGLAPTRMYITNIPAGSYLCLADIPGYKTFSYGSASGTLTDYDCISITFEKQPTDQNGCGSKPATQEMTPTPWQKALLPILVAGVVLATRGVARRAVRRF